MCTTSGISPSFLGLSQSSGQVTHVLLTRSRLCPRASSGSSLHLHVLSTPPAFVLSQDQTLREELHKERLSPLEGTPVHMRCAGRLTGLLLSTTGTSLLLFLVPVIANTMPASRNLDTFGWQGANRCACC